MSNRERKTPKGIGRYIGQALTYALFAALLGFFSASPDWTYFPADKALVKLSFTHAGKRKEACRKRTAKELENIPNSAKVPMACPRERHSVHIKLWMNGEQAYSGEAKPGGLSKDGPARVYQTFQVPPGKYDLRLEVRDSGPEAPGFSHDAKVELRVRDILAIDLDRSALVLHLPSR